MKTKSILSCLCVALLAVAAVAEKLELMPEVWENRNPLGGDFTNGIYSCLNEAAHSFAVSKTVPLSSNAVASVTFAADQTVSGVAINLLAPGLALFACRRFFDGAAMSPIAPKLPKIFGDSWMAGTVWSNLNVNVTTVIALLLTIAVWFVLYRTKWGLRVRAVGEHPAAADTLGIDVYKVRYVCVILSGVFAGFGGASMTIAIISQFTQTAISGHGFIAMAAVIFGKWTPFGAYGACLLFGATQALTVLLGGGVAPIPSQILAMLPYAMTIIVLILFVGKSVAPKADGVPYIKGSR